LGNKAASGTEIIKELGEEHLRTGFPIVYTSADSVFQIAAHEQVIPVERLYHMCREARRLLRPPHQVARVIARPFTGEPGSFQRTEERRDFSLDPPGQMLLDLLKQAGHPVVGIGKIDDLFKGRGLTRAIHAGNNEVGMDETVRILSLVPRGLIFVNLVDFDMLYGHRNDAAGYARALESFDAWLPELLSAMRQGDLLCVTADHGNDPTMPGTDHTREYVPLLAYGPRLARGVNLGIRRTFADLGQTIADALGVKRLPWGEGFLDSLTPG
jgi:phosphopentomutase